MNDPNGKTDPINKRYRDNRRYRIIKAIIGMFFLLGLGITGSRTHNKSTKAIIEAIVYIFVLLSWFVLMRNSKSKHKRTSNQKLTEDSDKS